MARSVPTDEAFEPPRPVTNMAGIYSQAGNATLYENSGGKVIVLQVVIVDRLDLLKSYNEIGPQGACPLKRKARIPIAFRALPGELRCRQWPRVPHFAPG